MSSEHLRSTFHWLAAGFYALGLVICLLGFSRLQSNMEDVFQWLPDETPERALYNQFVEYFGVDDFLVVTWPGCVVTDRRCDQFVDLLSSSDAEQLIGRALSGRDLIRSLADAHGMMPSEAMKRFQGLYFGIDHRSTCVLVMLTERGMDDRGSTVQFVKQVATEATGIAESELVLAGYPQVGAYGDSIIRNSIRDYVGPCCLISTLVALICLRSLLLTLAILSVGGLAAGLSVAVVTLSGQPWGVLSSMIPTLAYILSVSGAMHLVHYSRTLGDGPVLRRLLRIGWKPCTLSALTTVAGMLSLCRSEFPAVRGFGFYAACGVMVSLACQLLLIPCAIDWIAPRKLDPLNVHQRSRFLDRLIPWSPTVVALFVAITLIAAIGLGSLRSELEVERHFWPGSAIIRDIATLEQTIGPIEQTELMVKFHAADAEGFLDRIRAIGKLQSRLLAEPQVSTVLSLTAWLPEKPEGRGLRQTAARSMLRRQLAKARHQLCSTSYLQIDGDSEIWRVSIRFPFLQPIDFSRIKTSLPAIASETLHDEFDDDQVSVSHTGVSLLYHVAQEDLVADLYRNYLFAFLLIWPMMMLALRSLVQGTFAMIPNLCPAVGAYGLLGWLDYPIDLGMAMAACVALGIAVDDTTHFMLRFQELSSGTTVDGFSALKLTFLQCSRAMTDTSLVAGFGLAAFLFAPLAGMTRFAGLLIGLILIALLCDYVLLPALIVVFRRSHIRSGKAIE